MIIVYSALGFLFHLVWFGFFVCGFVWGFSGFVLVVFWGFLKLLFVLFLVCLMLFLVFVRLLVGVVFLKFRKLFHSQVKLSVFLMTDYLWSHDTHSPRLLWISIKKLIQVETNQFGHKPPTFTIGQYPIGSLAAKSLSVLVWTVKVNICDQSKSASLVCLWSNPTNHWQNQHTIFNKL